MSRLKFGLAQLGKKSNQSHTLSMALALSDLPSGRWKQLDERSWRTGVSGSTSDAIARAREIESVTAWRSFEQLDISRWLWIQVIPLTSKSDAEAEIPDLFANLLTNPRSGVAVLEQRSIEDIQVPGVDKAIAIEQLTNGKSGSGSARYLAANVDRIIFVVACSSFGDGWTWNEVASIAALQSSHIRERLI